MLKEDDHYLNLLGLSQFFDKLKVLFATKNELNDIKGDKENNTTTIEIATTEQSGLMSPEMVTKLEGIAVGANKYTHPTTAGNKHIPTGGSAGKILRWSASGTAVWGDDIDTTYDVVSKTAPGLTPQLPDETTTTKYLRQDGTWVTPPNTNTKNTAGSTNSSSKLFLVGATSQAANPQTYSRSTTYIGTDGCLYSNGTRVISEVTQAKEPTTQKVGDYWIQEYT